MHMKIVNDYAYRRIPTYSLQKDEVVIFHRLFHIRFICIFECLHLNARTRLSKINIVRLTLCITHDPWFSVSERHTIDFVVRPARLVRRLDK